MIAQIWDCFNEDMYPYSQFKYNFPQKNPKLRIKIKKKCRKKNKIN
jgi:hypothetical protein